MRAFIVAGLLAVWSAVPAVASDVALAIGNIFYRNAADVPAGDRPYFAARALGQAGLETISGRDAPAAATDALVEAFANAAYGADGVIAVLSGRFVHSATDSFFLPVDAQAPRLSELPGEALPLSTIMAILARHPGRAVLVLASEPGGTARQYLTPGIGPLTIPQGVTVIRGRPIDAGRFVNDVLARPGQPMVAGLRGVLQGEGYLPDGAAFLDPRIPPVVRPVQTAAEAWAVARRADTIQAYEAFIVRFPDGEFARQARMRINELMNEPNRAARLAEEALGLTRADRVEIQRDLQILGHDPRGIDGVFGQGTRTAIVGWQAANALARTGYLDRYQINRLDAQASARAAEIAAEREAQDRAFWASTGARGDEAGLTAYLQRYPEGIFAVYARQRLAALTEDRRDDPQLSDREAFIEARQRDTIPAYRQYVRAFPEGAFVAFARDRIAALREARGPQEPEFDEAEAQRIEASLNIRPMVLALIQRRLQQFGMDPGPAEGQMTDQTRAAIRRLQAEVGLPETGYLDEATVTRIWAGI